MRPIADVAVLLPGITGSVLRDSGGPDLWAATAGAAAWAVFMSGQSLADLELRDGDADGGGTAPLIIPNLHLIPGLGQYLPPRILPGGTRWDALGDSACQARNAIRGNPADPAWLAYTLCADPAAALGAAPKPSR